MNFGNRGCYGYLKPYRQDTDPIPITQNSGLNYYLKSKTNLLSGIKFRINNKKVLIYNLDPSTKVFVNGTQIIDAVLNDGDVISAFNNEVLYLKDILKYSSMTSLNFKWKKELSLVPYYARTKHPIMLVGESGTGKDILARHIHDVSERSKKPFVCINCSTLTENLIESELFGHKRGSFTGSVNDRKGAFLVAQGGTLFLDEIGDLPLNLQPKILRALENNEIKPLGEDKCIDTDVRFICATHRDLKDLIKQGKFRSDLYYRLNVISVQVPALRNRKEDIEPLLRKFNLTSKTEFTESAINLLKLYYWPGNIRELRNFVFRITAMNPRKLINKKDIFRFLDFEISKNINNNLTKHQIKEKNHLLKMLKKYDGAVSEVSKALKLSKSAIYYKLKNWILIQKIYIFFKLREAKNYFLYKNFIKP